MRSISADSHNEGKLWKRLALRFNDFTILTLSHQIPYSMNPHPDITGVGVGKRLIIFVRVALPPKTRFAF
jgi:hypothetical protein